VPHIADYAESRDDLYVGIAQLQAFVEVAIRERTVGAQRRVFNAVGDENRVAEPLVIEPVREWLAIASRNGSARAVAYGV